MTLSRNSGTGSSITTNTYNFLGVQMAYSPAPQNADIKQGDSRSNTTNDEFSAAGVTPRARDQITVDGRTLAVQGVRAVFDWPSCIGFDCWYRG